MSESPTPWRTSSFCTPNGSACVEVAVAPTASWLVRDSKHRDGGALRLPDAAFAGLRGFTRRS